MSERDGKTYFIKKKNSFFLILSEQKNEIRKMFTGNMNKLILLVNEIKKNWQISEIGKNISHCKAIERRE